MRKIILALAILCPGPALAQGTAPTTTPPPAAAAPPMVGDKPLVQIGKKPAAKQAAAKPQSIAQKLQACQDIDDATKDRLNCYDAIFKPDPKAKATPAKGVNDCRFVKEEDERLTCYNGFADKIPRLPK